MKGLDLSRAYYNEIIKPLINDNLPQIANNGVIFCQQEIV